MSRALALYARLGFALLEDRGVYLLLQWRPDQQPQRA
jgi:ABC-type siderophore export system fused ATPase/permease subunit